MKREGRFSLFTAYVGILVAGSLFLAPAPSIAKSIKGTIVDVVPDTIRNITVTVRTDAGDTKTFQVTDPNMVDGLHMDEPVTVEQDEKGAVTKIIGGWNAKARTMPAFPMDKK